MIVEDSINVIQHIPLDKSVIVVIHHSELSPIFFVETIEHATLRERCSFFVFLLFLFIFTLVNFKYTATYSSEECNKFLGDCIRNRAFVSVELSFHIRLVSFLVLNIV